jgi:hypothetical protein
MLQAGALSRTCLVYSLCLVLLAACGGGTSPTSPSSKSQACAAYPDQATSSYVLPYPIGAAYYVAETTGHPEQIRYAIDFLMPIGTTITAARAGRVFDMVTEHFDTEHDVSQANYVLVRHADDSLGLYGHLTHHGALVAVGDEVATGQPVALSGNSGFSTQPHLHFETFRCSAPLPASGREGCPGTLITLPVVFRNTEPTSCGVQVGQTPLALPFWGLPSS